MRDRTWPWAHPAQARVLGLRPDGHLEGAGGDEQERGERARGERERQPAPDLERVVGAGDVIERVAARDDIRRRARRPQVCQQDVAATARGDGRSCVSLHH